MLEVLSLFQIIFPLLMSVGPWLLWWRNGCRPFSNGGKNDIEFGVVHLVLMSVFFAGVGLGIAGAETDSRWLQFSLPAAIIAFLLLFGIVMTQHLLAAHRRRRRSPPKTVSERWSSRWTNGVIVLVAAGLFWYGYGLYQDRQQAMQSLTDTFIEAVSAGDAETAYARFQPEVRATLDPDRFADWLDRSGLAAMTLTTVEDFQEPYKNSYGYRQFFAHDAAGDVHRFTLIFGGKTDNSPPPFSGTAYYIRSFSHDTANVRRRLKHFIDLLRRGQTQRARRMAFIHIRNDRGKRVHTLTGEELRDRARQLGLLNAERLDWAHPDHESSRYSTRQRVTVFRAGQTHPVDFRVSFHSARPGIVDDGVHVLAMEAVLATAGD